MKRVYIDFDTAGLLARLNLEEGGRVQQAVDKAVLDWDLQYVPWDSGAMGMLAYSATQIGSGEVVYPGPYARYLYYGEVMGPNIPIFDDSSGEPVGFFSPKGEKKHLTGKKLTYSKDINPLAGAFWFERMKADHLKDIVQEAKKNVGNK